MTLQFRPGDITAGTDEQRGPPAGPVPASDKYSPRTSVIIILGLSALLWGLIFLGVRSLLTLLS